MALRQKIETATSATLALCALAITLMLARSQFFPNKVARGGLQPEHEDEWQRYAVSSMRIGPEKAAVIITEFSDFQCPACYRLFRTLERRAGPLSIGRRDRVPQLPARGPASLCPEGCHRGQLRRRAGTLCRVSRLSLHAS
jgi:Protein-disulfide isomerase